MTREIELKRFEDNRITISSSERSPHNTKLSFLRVLTYDDKQEPTSGIFYYLIVDRRKPGRRIDLSLNYVRRRTSDEMEPGSPGKIWKNVYPQEGRFQLSISGEHMDAVQKRLTDWMEKTDTFNHTGNLLNTFSADELLTPVDILLGDALSNGLVEKKVIINENNPDIVHMVYRPRRFGKES